MKETDASHPSSGSPASLAERLARSQARYLRVLGSLRTEERVAARYARSHRELAEVARHARGEAQEWQDRYAELERSAVVRVVSRFRAQVERYAPQGSARRRVYGRAVLAVRGLVGRPAPGPGADAGGTESAPVAPEVPVIPMALQPEVSIVIPVHDQWALTAGCLRSIATDYAAVGFEVIVVDDASTDGTADALARVVGVNVVTLVENLGFLGAVNAGIAAARGRYVVLLNNDTVCQPGWLDALVDTAESDERIGVVGAKLVYPDGRLQEAGGIIWNDASGHNYGRDRDPEDPAFNFVRDVDYCSGACLLVRRELLATVGGLDPRFAPAYYEDTDLCFAARKHGYRVVYQPRAVVCHLEGASNGTDVTTGVKQYQVTNQRTFQAKWADALALQGEPAPDSPRLTSWRAPAGRALVIDHQIPMPDQDSGSVRMSELLGILTDLGLGVTFVPQNGIVIPRYRDALLARGIEVLTSPADLDPYLAAVGSAVGLVVLSRPTVAWANYPMIRSLLPSTTIVYDTVDLHYLRERGRAELEGGGGAEDGVAAKQNAEFHYGMELTLAGLTDQTWTVSPTERDALLAENPDLKVAVVPNIHRDEAPGPPFDAREGILFVGDYAHPPNVDAAVWLVREILPLVRAELPDVPVHLAGSGITDEVEALAGDGVVVHGWVPSLADLYSRVRLTAAPLRFGAGQKGKVGESLAHGVPVVTTRFGAQGFDLHDRTDAVMADSAADLARAIVDVHTDQQLWSRLSANGREAVSRDFSPESVRRSVGRILADLGVPVVA
jgi:GT2 family glycosyltransferase/glycosyltransferase involved in cell wall biosynthesis